MVVRKGEVALDNFYLFLHITIVFLFGFILGALARVYTNAAGP
jgi:hypothetical protein